MISKDGLMIVEMSLEGWLKTSAFAFIEWIFDKNP